MILIDLIDNTTTFPAITIDMSTLFMKWRYQVDDGKGGVGTHAVYMRLFIQASSLGSIVWHQDQSLIMGRWPYMAQKLRVARSCPKLKRAPIREERS